MPSATGVVPELDVVVDRGGEFDSGLPPAAVQELDLEATPEALHQGVVIGGADPAIEGEIPASRTCWLKAQDVSCVPRSEWMTSPSRPGRRWVAIPSALSTIFVVWVESIDQPTTFRLNVSSTTQQ